jgi:hypothetical protein
MRLACTLGVGLALASGTLGCFSVRHELPPSAYFGRLPYVVETEDVAFEADAFKSWALAGMMPYGDWGSSELLAVQVVSDAQTLRIGEIQTVFSPLDIVISIVPGTAAGLYYYAWATRTIRVSGDVQVASSK